MSQPDLEYLADRFHELADGMGIGHWTITVNSVFTSEQPEGTSSSHEIPYFIVRSYPWREEFEIDCFLENLTEDVDLGLEMTHELVHVLLEEATPGIELDEVAIEPVVHRLAKLLTSLGFAGDPDDA